MVYLRCTRTITHGGKEKEAKQKRVYVDIVITAPQTHTKS